MPKYEVTLNVPMAGDQDLEVQGVGVIRNGKSGVFELTEDKAEELKTSDGGHFKLKKLTDKSSSEGGEN